jgi:hypothetical protein
VDLIRARVAFRERPLLDVVDLAVRFCVENGPGYARLSCLVLVPAFAASWAAARAGGWLAGWAAAIVLAAFADAPFVVLASRLVFTGDARARDALRGAASAGPRLVAARLLQGAALGGSLALLAVPWLWVGSGALFLTEVIVLEQAAVFAAWARARRVARTNMGIATMAMLLSLVLAAASAAVVDMAGRELLEAILEVKAPSSTFTEGWSALALLGFWAVVPLRATLRFFVYLDLRTRSEGWDIQTRFAAIAARAADAEPA